MLVRAIPAIGLWAAALGFPVVTSPQTSNVGAASLQHPLPPCLASRWALPADKPPQHPIKCASLGLEAPPGCEPQGVSAKGHSLRPPEQHHGRSSASQGNTRTFICHLGNVSRAACLAEDTGQRGGRSGWKGRFCPARSDCWQGFAHTTELVGWPRRAEGPGPALLIPAPAHAKSSTDRREDVGDPGGTGGCSAYFETQRVEDRAPRATGCRLAHSPVSVAPLPDRGAQQHWKSDCDVVQDLYVAAYRFSEGT